VNHDFGFNIQVFAEPLDHPAPPERCRVVVRIMELPVKNGSRAVTTELGRVDGLTPEHLDTIAKSLQGLLRGAVQGTVDSLAYRIKNPSMGAIIDKMLAQWTPATGVPNALYNNRLGEPYREPAPLEVKQRVAWKDDGDTVHHGRVIQISEVCIEATPLIRLELDDGSRTDCYEKDIRPLLCQDCGEPQFHTDSGPVCKNGHGGAPAKEVTFT